jgi:hypothetical protein
MDWHVISTGALNIKKRKKKDFSKIRGNTVELLVAFFVVLSWLITTRSYPRRSISYFWVLLSSDGTLLLISFA